MTEEFYRTKVSVLYCILTVSMIATMIVVLRYAFFSDPPLPGGVIIVMLLLVLFLLMMTALMLYLPFVMRYTFRCGGLYVRGLFTKLDLPYSSITEVKETSCLLTFLYASYTSMSLDQLEISYNRRSVGRSGLVRSSDQSVIISPKKKEEFINMLEARVPGVQVTRKVRKWRSGTV